MKLLLGTTNPGKIADFRKYLVHANLELLTLKDIGFWDEPLEIGKTYEENAIQKASFYAEKTEYPTLSDDGGLEIDALDGKPGIESKRWLGPNATDQDRIKKVLEIMKDVPMDKRTARFRNIIMVYFPNERDHVQVEARIEGIIAEAASEKMVKGFPYRSVFFSPEKNKYYVDFNYDEFHRKKACEELLLKLEPWLD